MLARCRSFVFAGHRVRFAVIATVMASGGLVAGAGGAAQASQPAPTQVPIAWEASNGTACPGGTLVTLIPAVQSPGGAGDNSAMIALIYPSASTNCPAPGVDVLKAPGPTSAPGADGGAAALPLNAGDCTAGTKLFNQETTLIGGTPPNPASAGNLQIFGGSLNLSGGSLTFGGSLTSAGGNLSITDGNLTLTGGGTLTLNGSTVPVTGGSLSIMDGNLATNGSQSSSGGLVNLTGGTLNLSGGTLTLTGGGTLTLTGGDTLILTAGTLTTTGPLSPSGGPVNVSSGGLTLTGGTLALGGTCPSGDAAYAALQAGLTNVPYLGENAGQGQAEATEQQAPFNAVSVSSDNPSIPDSFPRIRMFYALNDAGTPVGLLLDPGLGAGPARENVDPVAFLLPSAIAGMAVVMSPFRFPCLPCR